MKIHSTANRQSTVTMLLLTIYTTQDHLPNMDK